MVETIACRRCGKPILVNAAICKTLEEMHWVCFHLEYEHGNCDPDEPCGDPKCFWKRSTGCLAGDQRK